MSWELVRADWHACPCAVGCFRSLSEASVCSAALVLRKELVQGGKVLRETLKPNDRVPGEPRDVGHDWARTTRCYMSHRRVTCCVMSRG